MSYGKRRSSRWKGRVKVGDRSQLGACRADRAQRLEAGSPGPDFINSVLGSHWEV